MTLNATAGLRSAAPDSRPDELPAGRRRDNPRLAPQALLAELARRCGMPDDDRTALLVVALNRPDRLNALAQDASNAHVLAEVARRAQTMLRPHDRYAFVANDELWLMLAGMHDESLAVLAGQTLRDSLLRPIRAPRADGSVAVIQLRPVVGGAWTARRTLGEPMTMVAAASDACARARIQEDHVLVDRLDDDAALVRRDQLERELRASLFANELDVHFQPQIDLATGRCVAVEALIRWTRADGSSVNPALIASICEERAMMPALTQFVLNNALRHQVLWASQGVDLSVSINLSAATVADSTFPVLVSHALSTWGVPGDRLTLELTESAIAQNEHAAIDFMRQLRDLGCQLAIDDFGTGYSSFAWLRQFPLNELKIDRSFVRELAAGGDDGRTARALIELAHAFRIRALAECVESAEIASALAAAGCDRAQGFRFSPAMPPQTLVAWCRRHDETAILNSSAEPEFQ